MVCIYINAQTIETQLKFFIHLIGHVCVIKSAVGVYLWFMWPISWQSRQVYWKHVRQKSLSGSDGWSLQNLVGGVETFPEETNEDAERVRERENAPDPQIQEVTSAACGGGGGLTWRLVEDPVWSGYCDSTMSRHTVVTQSLTTVHTPTSGRGGVTAAALRRCKRKRWTRKKRRCRKRRRRKRRRKRRRRWKRTRKRKRRWKRKRSW